MMNRQGKRSDDVEERMQSANEAFGKDIKMHRSKDFPWRLKMSKIGGSRDRRSLFWK